MRDEKLHGLVVLCTFEHFWRLRCRKSARRCGAKHISKSKCTKHTILGALLEVEMSKKCTPLWREAHFQVKMYKAHRAHVGKVHAVVARSTFPCQDVKKHHMFGPPLEVQMSFRAKHAFSLALGIDDASC